MHTQKYIVVAHRSGQGYSTRGFSVAFYESIIATDPSGWGTVETV